MKEQISAHSSGCMAAIASKTVRQFSVVRPKVIEFRKGGFLRGLTGDECGMVLNESLGRIGGILQIGDKHCAWKFGHGL